MTQWGTFVGLSLVVLVLLLVLAHLSQRELSTDGSTTVESTSETGRCDDGESEMNRPSRRTERLPSDTRATHGWTTAKRVYDGRELGMDGAADEPPDGRGRSTGDPPDLGTGALLANVALSQGLFAGVLVAAAWYTQIPLEALGIGAGPVTGLTAGAIGVAFGLSLYVAGVVGAAGAERVGVHHDEELRQFLAPDSKRGWILLLGGILPLIAVFEELLFRAALIGVISAGYGISPWLLAVFSSIAFALGHGAQGRAGIMVTGLLGFALAVAFIVTGSLVVVVVAHYVINALEFVVHEGLGIEWNP